MRGSPDPARVDSPGYSLRVLAVLMLALIIRVSSHDSRSIDSTKSPGTSRFAKSSRPVRFAEWSSNQQLAFGSQKKRIEATPDTGR